MTSTFGPRVIPRRSVAMAPFGGGNLASSAVISCAARAGNEAIVTAATQPSNSPKLDFRTFVLPISSPVNYRAPPSPMMEYGAQNNGCA
jgi:hypothetical protein